MVESVDTWDLKSHGLAAVSVQVRLQVPLWGFSSAGRAPALHAGGQRFDPAKLHQIILINLSSFKRDEIKSDGGVAQLVRAYGSYP